MDIVRILRRRGGSADGDGDGGFVSSMFFGAQRLRRCSGATPDLSNCSAWVSVIAERIWEAAIVAEAAVETRS